jgi:hemerythrin superfamily protein
LGGLELSRKVEHDEARKLLDEIEQTEQTDWDTIKGLFTAMYGHHKAEEGIVFPALKGFDQETNDLVERLITEHNAWNSAMSTMIGEHKFDRPKFLVLKVLF